MSCKNCGSNNGELIVNSCGRAFIQCQDCKETHTQDNWEKEK